MMIESDCICPNMIHNDEMTSNTLHSTSTEDFTTSCLAIVPERDNISPSLNHHDDPASKMMTDQFWHNDNQEITSSSATTPKTTTATSLTTKPSLQSSSSSKDSACTTPTGKRIRKKYQSTTDNLREQLIELVCGEKMSIKKAAHQIKMNYSTAKSIVNVYKREGRVQKKKKRTPLMSTTSGDNSFQGKIPCYKVSDMIPGTGLDMAFNNFGRIRRSGNRRCSAPPVFGHMMSNEDINELTLRTESFGSELNCTVSTTSQDTMGEFDHDNGDDLLSSSAEETPMSYHHQFGSFESLEDCEFHDDTLVGADLPASRDLYINSGFEFNSMGRFDYDEDFRSNKDAGNPFREFAEGLSLNSNAYIA